MIGTATDVNTSNVRKSGLIENMVCSDKTERSVYGGKWWAESRITLSKDQEELN